MRFCTVSKRKSCTALSPQRKEMCFIKIQNKRKESKNASRSFLFTSKTVKALQYFHLKNTPKLIKTTKMCLNPKAENESV